MSTINWKLLKVCCHLYKPKPLCLPVTYHGGQNDRREDLLGGNSLESIAIKKRSVIISKSINLIISSPGDVTNKQYYITVVFWVGLTRCFSVNIPELSQR